MEFPTYPTYSIRRLPGFINRMSVNTQEVNTVATTRIMPIHIGKGRSVARALKDVADYMQNPLKTEDSELISSYEFVPETAETEFLLAKSLYAANIGRDQGKRDIIAYHVRQSFVPGKVTPMEANAIGHELACVLQGAATPFLFAHIQTFFLSFGQRDTPST